jgi:hypothetical protein
MRFYWPVKGIFALHILIMNFYFLRYYLCIIAYNPKVMEE